MIPKLKYICPLLVVADMRRSRNFYEQVMGLKVVLDFGENISFDAGFSIHLKSHYQSLIDGREVCFGSNNAEIYFESENMDEIDFLLAKEGVEMVHAMREQPWRQRVVRFYDPDRHIIEIGESMEYLCFRLYSEGLTIAHISKTIMMAEDFVREGVRKFSC